MRSWAWGLFVGGTLVACAAAEPADSDDAGAGAATATSNSNVSVTTTSTGSVSTGGGATPSTTVGSGGAGTTTASSTASSSSTGSGGAPPAALPTCLENCASASDCGSPSAPFDADNYSCSAGHCVYEGCLNDAECQTLGNYVCRDLGAGTPFCQTACSSAADCATASAPFDADNYTCDAGACRYTGCNSDAECQTLGSQVCRDLGSGVPTCVFACATPSDCDQGTSSAYDADNYTCESGACVYQGCNDSTECQSLGDYSCVP